MRRDRRRHTRNRATFPRPIRCTADCRSAVLRILAILDRLKKEQTLEDVRIAVSNAKQAGIEIVHGFFTVGNPDETVEDMKATFEFAAELQLDTFGFNRLCVYRGALYRATRPITATQQHSAVTRIGPAPEFEPDAGSVHGVGVPRLPGMGDSLILGE
jgi:hypothetical protein